jgi:hypothetical protein
MTVGAMSPPSPLLHRSRTHPVRQDPKPKSKRRSRPAKEAPLDAEELSRRLEETQQNRERRRRERATKSEQYHHTPQVAAAAFARTATPDRFEKRDIHKLSRPVVKHFKVGDDVRGHANATTSTPRFTQAVSTAQAEMARAAERNQFQRTRDLEEAGRRDVGRGLGKPSQRDFNLSWLRPDIQSTRGETNDALLGRGSVEVEGSANSPTLPHLPISREDRPDWTEQDECADDKPIGHAMRLQLAPLLKKASRIWSLGSHRRGSRKSDTVVDVNNEPKAGGGKPEASS